MKTAKRIGRPLKPAAAGKRVSLGLKVGAETKRHIDAAARASGRTQSQEAEALIERALQYDRVFAAMNKSLAEIQQGSVDGAFRAQGYTPVRTPYGNVWAPPGYPMERSGFNAPEEKNR